MANYCKDCKHKCGNNCRNQKVTPPQRDGVTGIANCSTVRGWGTQDCRYFDPITPAKEQDNGN